MIAVSFTDIFSGHESRRNSFGFMVNFAKSHTWWSLAKQPSNLFNIDKMNYYRIPMHIFRALNMRYLIILSVKPSIILFRFVTEC